MTIDDANKEKRKAVIDKCLEAFGRAVKAKDDGEEACREIEQSIKELAATGADAEAENLISEWIDMVKRIKAGIKVVEDGPTDNQKVKV